MKKVTFSLCTLLMLICLSACNLTKHIELEFSATDIENIEAFHYSVRGDAKKKIIDQPEDIMEIMEMPTSLKVKEADYEEPITGSTTSFRFHLSDGESFEIIYLRLDAKKGRIRSSYFFD